MALYQLLLNLCLKDMFYFYHCKTCHQWNHQSTMQYTLLKTGKPAVKLPKYAGAVEQLEKSLEQLYCGNYVSCKLCNVTKKQSAT